MRTPLLAVTLALALAVGACGGADSGTTAAGDRVESDPVGNSTILDFPARSVDGSTVDVASLAGSDLVIWFWAPW